MDLGHQRVPISVDLRPIEVGSREIGEPDASAAVESLQKVDLPTTEWAIAVEEELQLDRTGRSRKFTVKLFGQRS